MAEPPSTWVRISTGYYDDPRIIAVAGVAAPRPAGMATAMAPAIAAAIAAGMARAMANR
jgi:hypothetical protein